MPNPSTPALLETIVRSFVPLRLTAAMRFSGMPQRPKPPMRMVMPFFRLAMAASGEEMRLSMGEGSEKRLGECTVVGRWAERMARFPDWPLGERPRGKELLGYTPVVFAKSAERLKRREMSCRARQKSECEEQKSAKQCGLSKKSGWRCICYAPGRLYDYQKKRVAGRGVCKSATIETMDNHRAG